MKKSTLVESIQRMHQIIGIKPNILIESEINEANAFATEGAKLFAKFFGSLEKDLVVGATSYSKNQVKRIVNKIGTSTLTADEMAVVKTLTKEAIAADRALIKNLSLEIFGEIQKLGKRQLKTKYYSEVKAGLKEILPDSEISKVIKDVDAKLTGGKVAPSPTPANPPKPPKQNATLKPNNEPSTPSVKSGELPPDADAIINSTAKSSAEAAAYMAQIEALGFNSKITKLLQLEYGKAGMANKTAAEIIDAGNQLARQLSEKDYGWVKRIWASISKDPAASITKAGKAGYKMIFWYSVLALSLAGAGIAFAIKNKVESKTGTKGSDILPDMPNIPDAEPKKQADADSVDWSKYKPQN